VKDLQQKQLVKIAPVPIARNNKRIMQTAQELAKELSKSLQAKVVLKNIGDIGYIGKV
jgi:hypothetical protein